MSFENEDLAGDISPYFIDKSGNTQTEIECKWTASGFGIHIFCDLCHQLLDDSTAEEHIRSNLHSSCSTYEVIYDTMQKTVQSRVVSSEKYLADIPLSLSNIVCVCSYCKKQPFISTKPLDIQAHFKDKHHCKDDSEVCCYYKFEAVVDTFAVAATLLTSCVSQNTYCCFKCSETFPNVNQADQHMSAMGHSLIQKNWFPGKNQLKLYLGKCELCTYQDMLFTSNTLLLFHLVKVHGNVYHSASNKNLSDTADAEELEEKVQISIRCYEFVDIWPAVTFVNKKVGQETFKAHLKSYESRIKAKKDFLLSLRGSATADSCDAEPSDSQLFSGPLRKAKHVQQYCCDLCQVPLGIEVNTVLRHISAFSHPSVSLYNTKVSSDLSSPEPTTELISIHNYGVFQDRLENYKAVLFKCSGQGCSFISPDPTICYVHQKSVHFRENVVVQSYHLHTRHSYLLKSPESGVYHCPVCDVKLNNKSELVNHISGMKHHFLIDRANNVIEIGKCDMCSPKNEKSMFAREAHLIDHLMKHCMCKRNGDSQITVPFNISSFRYNATHPDVFRFQSDWLKKEVLIHILRDLMRWPSTSKVMKKRYRQTIQHLTET